MPTVSVNRDRLFEALGKTYTDDEFQILCFEYGVELDDVTTEKEMLRKELNREAGKEGADLQDASEEILYKIDVPANRYDMLCLEGISRVLNIFKGNITNPIYRLADLAGRQPERMYVKPETALIRPFVVCAILRGVTLNAARYSSFIDLQDKLHQNLCRQRSLVAIGTHDLSTIKGPFTYEALPPEEIKFIPLKQTREFVAKELLQFYAENDDKLKKFVPLIADSVVYPVIYDVNRVVLSLPPIINSAHSAITLDTRDVLVECTATDLTKASIVLNTVVCMFSQYCDHPFEVEPVEVVDSLGQRRMYPELACRKLEVPASKVNGSLGLDLKPADMADLLSRMQLSCAVQPDGSTLSIQVPPTRSDVLHACDVVEDVAISYGYNNIPRALPTTYTAGSELPLNQLSDLLRLECAMAGFTEILTWALCSKAENFDFLRRPALEMETTAVQVGNPATAEFEVCRTSLLPGALKTLAANKEAPLPIRLFEISDVVLLSTEKAVGSKNERHLVAVYSGKESGFEVVQGLLNRIMEQLGVPHELSADYVREAYGGSYCWRACDNPTFFPGRAARVLAKDNLEVGHFGIVHPEVLKKFDIQCPVSALELNIEPFCFDQHYKPLI